MPKFLQRAINFYVWVNPSHTHNTHTHTQNCLTELAVEQPRRKKTRMLENFRQNGRRRLKMACTACAAVCMSLLLASKTSSTQVVLTPEEWPRALPGASGDGTSWVSVSTLPCVCAVYEAGCRESRACVLSHASGVSISRVHMLFLSIRGGHGRSTTTCLGG